MTDYIVVNDLTGDFIAIDHIIAITDAVEGSEIVTTLGNISVRSPLKPRELLRRLTIIKYKRENEKRSDIPFQAPVANSRRSTL